MTATTLLTSLRQSAQNAGQLTQHFFTQHPIRANSLLCLNFWVVGDILAQYTEHRMLLQQQQEQDHDKVNPVHVLPVVDSRKDENTTKSSSSFTIDYNRTIKCASFGAVVAGPLVAMWYPYMERVSKSYKLASKYGPWGPPIAKVMADQCFMDPPCIALYYSYMHVYEHGGSVDLPQLKHTLKTEMWPTWVMSCMTWPIVMLGTFRYLPIHFQAPLVNICCIAWDGYLSHRNAKLRLNKKEEEEALLHENQTEPETNTSSTPKENGMERERIANKGQLAI
jgi:hypothetical protein